MSRAGAKFGERGALWTVFCLAGAAGAVTCIAAGRLRPVTTVMSALVVAAPSGSKVAKDSGQLEAEFEIAPDPRRLAELRSRTREVLREWQLPGFHIDVAVLAAHELTVNALLYAGGPATLRLAFLQGRLRIEVSDTGQEKPTPREPEPDEFERGHGLTIITNLADTWGHYPTPTGKTVWCELLV